MIGTQTHTRTPVFINNLLQTIRQRESLYAGLALAVITLAGLGLRLYEIEQIPAVWDEVFNYNVARQDFGGIINTVTNAIEPPTYYFLFHIWTLISGGTNDEFHMRFLSMIIGTAIIPASYWLFRQIANRGWALVGAVMVAANGYHLYYSQYAKNYVQVTLLSFIALALFLQIISRTDEHKDKDSNLKILVLWGGWTFTNTLIAYTHYFSAYIVFGQYATLGLLILLGRIPRIRFLLYALGSVAGAFVLYLPWLGRALNSLAERASDPGWLYYKLDFDFFLRQALGLPNLFLGLPVTDMWLYGMAVLLLTGGVLSVVASRFAPQKQLIPSNRVLTLWLLLPTVVAPYLGVMIYSKSQLETRNFLGGVGAVIYALLVLALQRSWEWKKWLAVLGLVGILLLTAFSARHYYRWGTHGDDYRVMVSKIRELQALPSRPTLMIPMKPVEDVLRFYMTPDELNGMLEIPKPPESAEVSAGGLIVVLDQRFADLDWDIKRLVGHLQTYNRVSAHFTYPGCQVYLFLPGKS
jgi:uncharacterized membrane protein